MLRNYQEKIIDRMMWDMNNPGNSIISLALGGGKTHIIAEFADKLNQPILIFTPNKELLEQDHEKLVEAVGEKNVGIFSASKNRKEINKYTIATIQSAYKHPELFNHYTVAIIDECEAYNPKKMSGMYNTFFKKAGIKKVFGLTGTPYRLDSRYERWGMQKWQVKTIGVTKMINRYYPVFWNRMLAVLNPIELTKNGFLCPLTYHQSSLINKDEIPPNKSKSEYDLEKFDQMIEDKYFAISEAINKLDHRLKLVFCTSIKQADGLRVYIPDSKVVTSETKKKDREDIVKQFKMGRVKVLLNVGIFTAGFNVPELDCLCLLRPTRSLRLHMQMLGRVCRNAPGKEVGHVYDFVGNSERMGEMDDVEVKKLDTGWNVVSKTNPQGWHMQDLFSYKLKQPKKDYDKYYQK